MAQVPESFDPQRPPYKLYSLAAIDLATFFGSFVAGALLVAANSRKLGDPDSSRTAIAVGLAGFTGLVFAVFLVPGIDELPDAAFPILQVAAAHSLAWRQQKALRTHQDSGGSLHSTWRAVGIGVLASPLSLAIVLGASSLTQPRLAFGPDHEVYYREGATRANAERLGNTLQEIGLFKGEAQSVQIDGLEEGFAISFALRDGGWDDPTVVGFFKALRDFLAAEVFDGSYVEIRLTDSQLVTKRVLEPGLARSDYPFLRPHLGFGPKQEVYYRAGATEDDAQRLGKALEEIGFFGEGHSATVLLATVEGGFAVSFALEDGAWEDAEAIESFRAIRDHLAANAFRGAPLEIRLCDNWFFTRRAIGATE